MGNIMDCNYLHNQDTKREDDIYMDFRKTCRSGCNWLSTVSKGMVLKLQFYHQTDTATLITTATLLHKIECPNLKTDM